MALATVVRVRRKREVEKPDSLVISCKRQRVDSPDGEGDIVESSEIETTFKYAGTIEEKTEPVERHILTAVKKSKLEKEYKRHQIDIPIKTRQEQRRVAKSKRYKVTSQKRDLELKKKDTPSCGDSAAASASARGKDSSRQNEAGFCVYDLEEEVEDLSVISQVKSAAASKSQVIMCNGSPMIREVSAAGPTYVYDLYYVNTPGFDHQLLDHITSVQAYGEEFIYDGYRGDEPEEYYEDEDDSNDEGNWRNDYPDEDPFIYENEDAEYYYGDDGTRGFDSDDDLPGAMKAKCALGDEEEEWSSAEEDTGPKPPSQWWATTSSWEQYKKRVTKELEEDKEVEKDSESSSADEIT